MYQQFIREVLAQQGRIGQHDPRHVEAFMRVEHSTLDGLSRSQFASEVDISCACINECGKTQAESIARSFGL